MGLLDRFKNLKEAAQEWSEGSSIASFARNIEYNLVAMESGSDRDCTAAVKTLRITA